MYYNGLCLQMIFLILLKSVLCTTNSDTTMTTPILKTIFFHETKYGFILDLFSLLFD